MIPPEEALRRVLSRTRPMPAVRRSLAEAEGRVTVRDIRAPFPLPRFVSSAMDGYAVASRDTRSATRGRPVRLRVRPGAVFAGESPGAPAAPGEAVRIMTGAALPQHVDAVIPQEDVRLKKGALVIRRAVRAGDHVRRSGEDCGRGDVAIPKGTRLHPGAMALLSMLGVRQVAVRRAPRVGIVITGSEVRPAASRSLPAYAVRDSHAPFLTAALDEFGLTPSPVLYTRDDARPIREGIVRALARADLVIVTGGVSVGDRDLVRPVLSELGARTIVEGVAQRPGKPLYFGVLRGTAVFGLPGNPGSLVVCYCEYVRPVIRAMLGEAPRLSEEWTARLAEPVARRDSRTQFLRGRLAREDGAWRVALDRRQGSNLLGSFLASDCLVVVPPGPGRPVRVGSVVRVRPLPWRRG